MCQSCRDNPQRTAALTRARDYARGGNRVWTALFIERAQSFAFVSRRQINYINKLLVAAGSQPLEIEGE